MKKRILALMLITAAITSLFVHVSAANGNGELTAKVVEAEGGWYLAVTYSGGNNSIISAVFEVVAPDGETALYISPAVTFKNKTGTYSFRLTGDIPENSILRMTENKKNKPVVATKIFAGGFKMPATNGGDIGRYWMSPKGNSFIELFANLDKWPATQSKVDVIGFADHVLYRSYTVSERRAGFAAMRDLGIPLALEVGAIKDWGFGWLNAYHGGDKSKLGYAIFEDQHTNFWSRFAAEGAEIKGFALDEPLVAVMGNPGLYGFSNTTQGRRDAFDFAVGQTAQFILAVQENYPGAIIGDIEAFPHFTADYIIAWIDALEAELLRIGARGQDFFRLDVNWADNRVWDFKNGNAANSGWAEVRRIEEHCRSIGLPFSLIYWAPDYSGYEYKDRATDRLWYDQVMAQGAHYLAAGGSPDQYVVQTWIVVDGVQLP